MTYDNRKDIRSRSGVPAGTLQARSQCPASICLFKRSGPHGVDQERCRADRADAILIVDSVFAAEAIYLAEVHPQDLADIVIDNHDFARPRVLRQRAVSSR